MSKETGGPAFPSGNEAVLGDWRSSGHAGMTLRDYFAAKASEEDIKFWRPMGCMVEKIREDGSRKSIYHEPGMYTREQARYRYADAMVKARVTT